MLNSAVIYNAMRECGVSLFTGVPDSLLKDFCAFITRHTPPSAHVIAANEGGAVAIAAGHHLATGGLGLVYMQNSGQGNAVNPLISLADPEVYAIPMLLLIGWRGEPGRPDEPQHIKQGKITAALLDTMQIAYAVLPERNDDAVECIRRAAATSRRNSAPFALLVRKAAFAPQSIEQPTQHTYDLTREAAIRWIAERLQADAVVVATTGKASRELYEIRKAIGAGDRADFLTVGSMGYASQIALGIALACPGRKVYCIDGDGAVIMHMGALAVIGGAKPINFKHVVINNGAHDSVGGQPTAGFAIDIPAIARACGYRFAMRVESADDLACGLGELVETDGPAMLEVRVRCGARADLGRPACTPIENKQAFMQRVQT